MKFSINECKWVYINLLWGRKYSKVV
jgi:hypothetical protein